MWILEEQITTHLFASVFLKTSREW
jgi:hypothetical protein